MSEMENGIEKKRSKSADINDSCKVYKWPPKKAEVARRCGASGGAFPVVNGVCLEVSRELSLRF